MAKTPPAQIVTGPAYSGPDVTRGHPKCYFCGRLIGSKAWKGRKPNTCEPCGTRHRARREQQKKSLETPLALVLTLWRDPAFRRTMRKG